MLQFHILPGIGKAETDLGGYSSKDDFTWLVNFLQFCYFSAFTFVRVRESGRAAERTHT